MNYLDSIGLRMSSPDSRKHKYNQRQKYKHNIILTQETKKNMLKRQQ